MIRRMESVFVLGAVLLVLLGCAASSGIQSPHVIEKAASIGVATMSADGSIRLQLRAEGSGGAVGDAVVIYRPSDPMYEEVRKHIGGIRPGEEKPVPPWPSSSSHQHN